MKWNSPVVIGYVLVSVGFVLLTMVTDILFVLGISSMVAGFQLMAARAFGSKE